MSTYEAPRVTFVGSDPKIPALRAAIKRVSRRFYLCGFYWHKCGGCKRFVGLWQARNRRTRVLMWRIREANDAA